MLWNVTYETWDTEAIEAGDTDDKGFLAESVCLRDALDAVCSAGGNAGGPGDGGVMDGGRGFYFSGGINGDSFQSDERTECGLHPVGAVTPSSWGRIARMIGAR